MSRPHNKVSALSRWLFCLDSAVTRAGKPAQSKAPPGAADSRGDSREEFVLQLIVGCLGRGDLRAPAVVHGKATLCGFNGTNLDMILRSAGIRNCVVCGFLTNVCVESTARTAYDRGYRVAVAKDAGTAPSQEQQEYPERHIFPLLGSVMTVDELLASIQ